MLASHASLALVIDLDVQAHGVAAHRTVLDVVLLHPARYVHGDHDLLTAGFTDIRRLEVGRGTFPAFGRAAVFCHGDIPDQGKCSGIVEGA